jgi:hypothetical protein
MNVSQQDYLAQKAYYDDQARAAARDRLVRVALASRGARSRLSRALSWLGARLVAWATSLRDDDGGAVPARVSQSARPVAGH